MNLLPDFYSEHLQKHFSKPQYLLLVILIHLLPNIQTVKLASLARSFPYPILERSRVKKIQRFLSLPQLNVKTVWFPIVSDWIEQQWNPGEVIHLVIDRSQWRTINLMMVSVVYRRRSIPINFTLLDKIGNSNLSQQQQVLSPVLELLYKYKVIVLGDREFCSVELARWLSVEQQVYLSLRLRKSTYVELEPQIWFQLKQLGLAPGMSLYYQGIKVTKTKGFGGLNLAAKSKRNYRDSSSTDPWYLLTNLGSLSTAVDAYSQRMGIEEMFRDFKSGGYNLEDTRVNNQRLTSLILLICLSYTIATLTGETIKQKGVAKYVTRPTETHRTYSRHSSFSIGLHGHNWVNQMSFLPELIQELLRFSRHKSSYHLKGMRAISLIQSAL
ncbi:IS4 family transposase [Moorena sp. SIO3B2]|uniref:IS4 family transposase n=1 Tax=Moorena sp. SIO3B2 TaxID=2607827 RepID=UPI0013C737D0|nr:IS4 family transposase [Moorena sp. SIO3B2]NEP34873.1 IS4 family transposase [Moorena sp. SIO3B2]